MKISLHENVWTTVGANLRVQKVHIAYSYYYTALMRRKSAESRHIVRSHNPGWYGIS